MVQGLFGEWFHKNHGFGSYDNRIVNNYVGVCINGDTDCGNYKK